MSANPPSCNSDHVCLGAVTTSSQLKPTMNIAKGLEEAVWSPKLNTKQGNIYLKTHDIDVENKV